MVSKTSQVVNSRRISEASPVSASGITHSPKAVSLSAGPWLEIASANGLQNELSILSQKNYGCESKTCEYNEHKIY